MAAIVTTKDTLGGKRRIAGTRISVDLVYTYLKDRKLKEFHRDYPHISDEQIKAAIDDVVRTLKQQRDRLDTAAA